MPHLGEPTVGDIVFLARGPKPGPAVILEIRSYGVSVVPILDVSFLSVEGQIFIHKSVPRRRFAQMYPFIDDRDFEELLDRMGYRL